MLVLGIETSCDETGLALYESSKGLLADVLYSQVKRHAEFGGVVPELASRDHLRKLVPLLNELLRDAKVALSEIDAIAYTKGPGLIGPLLVGSAFAKSLAFSLGIPSLGVHHLEAHLVAPMLEEVEPELPHLALLVSGGHSQILSVHGLGQYKLLGQTLDDAVGEAFDKTAKLLGLPYPGGPELAKLAQKGNDQAYPLTKPMVARPGLDLSFSGLKTQVLTLWRNSEQTSQVKADIAACFEKTVCDTLLIKIKRALKQTKLNRLVVSGGVSANLRLRKTLDSLRDTMDCEVFYPRQEFCTDNGAMVALLGHLYLSKGHCDKGDGILVSPRLPLSATAGG